MSSLTTLLRTDGSARGSHVCSWDVGSSGHIGCSGVEDDQAWEHHEWCCHGSGRHLAVTVEVSSHTSRVLQSHLACLQTFLLVEELCPDPLGHLDGPAACREGQVSSVLSVVTTEFLVLCHGWELLCKCADRESGKGSPASCFRKWGAAGSWGSTPFLFSNCWVSWVVCLVVLVVFFVF